MKISALITREEKWTQNCLGRDKEGKPLFSFDTFYTSKFEADGKISYQEYSLENLAKSFSLYGAVVKCYGLDSRHQALDKLRHAIRKVTGRDQFLATFNNDPSTKYADIKMVLRLAGV